jgi:L-iditol 2-dehydrogenase
MKAAVIAGKGKVELRDAPTPAISSHEILVRMRSCGICGTDIEKVHGEHITPPILGHEVAGDIEQLGKNVQDFKVGDRVIVHHHISCRSCFYCKNGLETLCEAYPRSNLDPCGFSENFRIPESLVDGGTVYKIPDSMSYDDGSQVEPTACCIRALRKTGAIEGRSVVVFGVGPVGMTHVQLLKLYGATPIFAVDVIEQRRALATKVGANAAFDPVKDDVRKEMANGTDSRGPDFAIVATGNPKAIQQAILSVRKGGKVLLFGAPARGTQVSLDVSQLFLREVSFEASYSTSETEMRIALELIAAGKIRPSTLITHRLPLERFAEAILLAESGRESVKVIVQNQ